MNLQVLIFYVYLQMKLQPKLKNNGKTNQRTIKIYDSNDKYLGSETFDERFTKSDINKLLNKKYPWTWEYYT